MTPAKYLHSGAACVLLIIALIAGQNWLAGDRVARQHDEYLTQEGIRGALDDLQMAAQRIVSSANEAALLTTLGKPQTANVDANAEEREADIVTEYQEIEDAKLASQKAISLLNSAPSGEAYGITTENVVNICKAFDELLKHTDALVTLLSAGPSAAGLFEVKERQEAAERGVLQKIRKVRATLNAIIDSRGAALAADFQSAKTVNLLAGVSAAALLLFLSIFFGGRIQGMFARIETQSAQITAANGGLEAALGELKALQQALIDKEKLSTLGRLTATVSHELRNPLGALRNSLFSLRKQAGAAAGMVTLIDRADRNVARCDSIIGELLEYTRNRGLDRRAADLRDLVREAAANTRAPDGVTYSFDLADAPVMAAVDRDRFPRVLINLIENAGQAMTAARRKGAIRIGCRWRGETAVITVADTGCGVAAEIRSKIFEPLFTTKGFGAGLGLAIAKSLVDQHGGELSFDTEPGKGTTFRIQLPATPPPGEQSKAA